MMRNEQTTQNDGTILDESDNISPKRERMLARAREIIANTNTNLSYAIVSYWPDERLQAWLDSWEGKDAHVTSSAQLPRANWRLPAADEVSPWLPPSANPCRL